MSALEVVGVVAIAAFVLLLISSTINSIVDAVHNHRAKGWPTWEEWNALEWIVRLENRGEPRDYRLAKAAYLKLHNRYEHRLFGKMTGRGDLERLQAAAATATPRSASVPEEAR